MSSIKQYQHQLMEKRSALRNRNFVAKVINICKDDCTLDHVYTFADLDTLRVCQAFAINYCVNQRLEQKKNQNDIDLHHIDYLKIKNFFLTEIKQIYFLLKSIQLPQTSSKNGATIVKQIGYHFGQKFARIDELTDEVYRIHQSIFVDFIEGYQLLVSLPLNQIDEGAIDQAFLIKIEHINNLVRNVYAPIKNLHHKHKYQMQTDFTKSQAILKDIYIIIRHVSHIFGKISGHSFSLPMLSIDWQIATNFTFEHVKKKTRQILYFQERNKNNQEIRGTHLIFQGVFNSNEYMGALYTNIQNQDHEKAKDIKAITCANFQAVFGFLLSLNKSPHQIRREMYKVSHLANAIESEDKILKYFDTYAWVNNTTNRYAEYLDYLEQEHDTLFSRVSNLSEMDFTRNSPAREFENIRLVYMSEKERLMATYEKILDETAENMQLIEERFIPSEYALEISKKYGQDYRCELKHNHAYSEEAKKATETFTFIARKLITTFGSLINGIISNTLVARSLLRINKQNAAVIVKGILTNSLLTSFKLKDYVIKKLVEERMNPNISLSEFYDVSKRKILLNFTVVNMNQQRLAFLNKNTMPNMPVWAAILATSSIPLFHHYFEARKEWEATDSSSFYEFFVYDFFNSLKDSNRRVTRYSSANFISSVPLELVTNNTIEKKILSHQEIVGGGLNEFAICFQKRTTDEQVNLKIEKNYLNVELCDYIKIGCSSILPGVARDLCRELKRCLSCLHLGDPHDNDKYVTNYSLAEAISIVLQKGNLSSTINTLVNSNDNFTLKWYFDKLIRLPIKVGTLDFHEIVDEGAKCLRSEVCSSEKAAETIKRSYDFTKFFIADVFNRKSLRAQDFDNRLVAKLRVQVLQKMHKIKGFKRKYLKLNMLNHSKWNMNYYNHFAVEYLAEDKKEDMSKHYQRAEDSEIIWCIQQNACLDIKFFYVIAKQIDGQIKHQIMQTYVKFDFINLVNKLPLMDAQDYQFNFDNPGVEPDLIFLIKPIKRNGYYIERNRDSLADIKYKRMRRQEK